jgi:hypothetical protein
MNKLLPALERNILKYRALEMTLILFYIEDIKEFVIKSIRFTDSLSHSKERLPDGVKKLHEKAWSIVVSEGILSEKESTEIQKFIEYRNDIAHHIHKLTYDLSNAKIAKDIFKFEGLKYDYQALKKIRGYRQKIFTGFQGKFVMAVSFDRVMFESTEQTFEHELKILDKKITKQYAIRKQK